MKAKFEVTQIIQPWNPPFNKKIETKTYLVSEKERFDSIPKTNTLIFTLLTAHADKALIQYHLEFTLKGYVQPQNKQIWVEKDETKELAFLWGDDGLTKKITYQGLEAGAGETAVQEAPSRTSEERAMASHTDITPAAKRPVF
jgi:hypothetical protein